MEVQCGQSSIKKEEILLEKVQKRATKLIPELKYKEYPERLKELGLPTLKHRRLRAFMVETYKILNNIDKVEVNKIFHLNQNRTRGHKSNFTNITAKQI